MATIVSPSSHAQRESIVGFPYVFAGNQIRMEITEELNVLGAGLMSLYGELTGSGSDTVRVTRVGGIGFHERFQAMVSETDAILPTGHTLNYDELTLGRYGLAKEQTYTDQILARAESIGLAEMAAMVPMSYLATVRYNLATIGATFASGFGTTGVVWTFDDELNLIAGFHETEGFASAVQRNGGVVSVRHPKQYTQLRDSCRNEPSLQGSPAYTEGMLSLTSREGGTFDFLGIRNYASHDVPLSGGDYVGSAYVPGAIGMVTASTTPVMTENPGKTVYVPEFGIVIEFRSTGEIATARFAANAFVGFAKLSNTLFPQFKITSLNA